MNEDKTTDKDMGVITGGVKRGSKKLWLKLVILIIIVVAGGITAWWFWYQNANYLNISGLDGNNDRIAAAQQLVAQPVPDKPLDKAVYYGEIATYLQIAQQYTYSERYYLTAQKIVDDNHVDMKEARFYTQLAAIYKARNNTAKADEYTKKEDAFIQQNYSKEEIDQMKGATLDEPHKK